MPARPENVSGSPPSAMPEPGQLGEPAGDERGLRVVAVAEAVRDPRRDRDHVLQRAGDLAPDDVGVRVHPERRGHEQRLQRRRPRRRRRSRPPTRSADRARPRAPGSGRSARRCGRAGGPGSTSATPRSCAAPVPCSTPFDRLRTGTSAPIAGAAVASTSRNPCDGTPMHHDVGTGARRHEIRRRVQRLGQRDVGEVVGVARARRSTRAATAGSRAHRTVSRVDRRRSRRPRCPTSRHRSPRPCHRRASARPSARSSTAPDDRGLGRRGPTSRPRSASGCLRVRARGRRATCSQIAPMIRSVAVEHVLVRRDRAAARRRAPTSATPVRQRGLRPLNITRCSPHSPTGTTGAPVAAARRAVPGLARPSGRGRARSCPRGTP